jgi:hypothetical protein
MINYVFIDLSHFPLKTPLTAPLYARSGEMLLDKGDAILNEPHLASLMAHGPKVKPEDYILLKKFITNLRITDLIVNHKPIGLIIR